MAAFPGDPDFECERAHSLDRGDPYNLSRLALGTHVGTHLDPPIHFIPGGATIDRVDPEVFNGRCRVVRVPDHADSVEPEHLRRIPPRTPRVLFRTRNSERWARSDRFFPDYVAVSAAAAKEIVDRGIRLVGIDSLSIERDSTRTFPTHHELLGHGTIILEGLCLARASPGPYDLRCLPLRIKGGDGGPARALLYPR